MCATVAGFCNAGVGTQDTRHATRPTELHIQQGFKFDVTVLASGNDGVRGLLCEPTTLTNRLIHFTD